MTVDATLPPDAEAAEAHLLHVLRVFTDTRGQYGNPLGVFLRGSDISGPDRQPLAAALAFSETVYIDDPDAGRLRIYSPQEELSFAGHPLVGAAWLLGCQLGPVTQLNPPAGSVQVWIEGETVWIRGRPQWCPTWAHVQTSVEEVERATEAPPGHDHVQVWGFEDESAGIVRARVFAPRFGVAEDEACGSASMLLAARLGRPLVIHHGSGSEIFVRPAAAGAVELGGRVKLEHTHEINVRHVQPLP